MLRYENFFLTLLSEIFEIDRYWWISALETKTNTVVKSREVFQIF